MKVDVSAYLVVGRENTNGRPVAQIVKAAVQAGFTCIQIRSKIASAKEMLEDCRDSAKVIADLGKSEKVALLVDDRLDVVLAARELGIKVDGIHVGQDDIPASVCRKFLGKDSIIGLTAPKKDYIDYVKTVDTSIVDYFGIGPVHATSTKPESGRDESGNVVTKTFENLYEVAKNSPVPVVVGGGVKLSDLDFLKKTGATGFFVVSAITQAQNPYDAAKNMVDAWR
ncbi:MAG: thiamine phosphate synthase [Treponema sp.]|nr:thiamine phosphate synthase [Treponema sp.]